MMKPVGYRIQKEIPCCANCRFGGYIGDLERIYICEILGEPTDGNYKEVAAEPLGLCDAHSFNV